VSKVRLVITAVTVENRPVADVARDYGVARSCIYELLARHRDEGEAAYEPRSHRPRASPGATPAATVDLVLRIGKQLTEAGLDAGADTIGWHLIHRHQTTLSRATIRRILRRTGAVTPDPAKRSKASYRRFEADQPNQTWQSDFTHYRLATGLDLEVITWLDDHSRYALHLSARPRITAAIVPATFRKAADPHGYPASTLTDNGMVYTTRFAGGRGGRNHLKHELRRLDIVQKNSRPNHATTCHRVERFQQTFKKWLNAQPHQPTTIDELQTLLEEFQTAYNQHRPDRSLPHRATPGTAYRARPKATPTGDCSTDSHDRVRHDTLSKTGIGALGGTARHRDESTNSGLVLGPIALGTIPRALNRPFERRRPCGGAQRSERNLAASAGPAGVMCSYPWLCGFQDSARAWSACRSSTASRATSVSGRRRPRA
jgi:transposase InsO family protein